MLHVGAFLVRLSLDDYINNCFLIEISQDKILGLIEMSLSCARYLQTEHWNSMEQVDDGSIYHYVVCIHVNTS